MVCLRRGSAARTRNVRAARLSSVSCGKAIERMIDTRPLIRWIRTAFAVLLGLVLLLSPPTSVSALPDHAPSSHARSMAIVGAGFEKADQLAGLPCSHHGIDHRACCGNACALCVVAIDTAQAVLLDLGARHRHYAWGDQAASGVAFPPLLGPPRPQA